MRAETGVMKFKDDWGGYFIRGDDAIKLLLSFKAPNEDIFCKAYLKSFFNDLEDCLGSDPEIPTTMKTFSDCKL